MAEQLASEQRFSSSRYGEGAQTVFSWIVIVCSTAGCSSTGEPGPEINPDEVGGGWEFAHSPINTVPAGVWHYITAVFDAKGKAVTIYMDGVQVGGPLVIPGGGGASGPGTWTSSTFSTTPPGQVQIGAEEDLSHAFYDGLIDELRIESVARSPQWIAAQAIAVSGDALALGVEERSK